jgi:hypothetical protein
MRTLVFAAAALLVLTPALAQQAEQPVADPSQQAPAAETQPVEEQSGLTQAAAQLAAQSADQQDQDSVAQPQQSPAGQPAMQQSAGPRPGEQAPSAQTSQDAAQSTAQPDAAQSSIAAQPPEVASPSQPRSIQRRALAVAPAIRPRADAASYPVYGRQQQLSVGARLLSAKEVEQKFSTPLGKHYLVVEVGLFPAAAQSLPVRPENFTLRVGNDDQAFFPATPNDIASALSGSGARNPRFFPTLGIGYGGWGRGVSTGVGVGVGSGPYPRGGMAGGNRRVMENELQDKSLPEGSVTQPAAGYLYFPVSGKRSAHYNLELTQNGETMSLSLPVPKD